MAGKLEIPRKWLQNLRFPPKMAGKLEIPPKKMVFQIKIYSDVMSSLVFMSESLTKLAKILIASTIRHRFLPTGWTRWCFTNKTLMKNLPKKLGSFISSRSGGRFENAKVILKKNCKSMRFYTVPRKCEPELNVTRVKGSKKIQRK